VNSGGNETAARNGESKRKRLAAKSGGSEEKRLARNAAADGVAGWRLKARRMKAENRS